VACLPVVERAMAAASFVRVFVSSAHRPLHADAGASSSAAADITATFFFPTLPLHTPVVHCCEPAPPA
jgi:hypothetical protein